MVAFWPRVLVVGVCVCVCVRKNKTLLNMNGLILFCLPKPIGEALSMHGINSR